MCILIVVVINEILAKSLVFKLNSGDHLPKDPLISILYNSFSFKGAEMIFVSRCEELNDLQNYVKLFKV